MAIRILFFGSKGWIGQQLYTLLEKIPRIQSIRSSECRADDRSGIQRELDTYQPTHVVSTIGRTHGKIDNVVIPTIDYLEYPEKLRENVNDNLYSPLLLAHECQSRSIHYTYLGTGCIFAYDDDHPLDQPEKGFTESDRPNFFGSSYSIVKGFTDRIMSLYPSTLNVRIRMPITASPNSRDFITKIVNYDRICSMANSMTVLDELLPLLVDMIVTKRTGTIQLTNPGVISHEEILTMYKEICDPSKTWKTMSYEEQNVLLKSKRSNNSLDTTLLQSWYPQVRDIHTAIRAVLVERSKL